MTPLGKAALALAVKGLRVFPLPPRKKEPPLFKAWERYATTDPQPIENWWSKDNNNIGIATGSGSGIWVLDIDGAEGEATLRRLETEHGALPPTIETTSGDGRHLYFRYPSGIEIRNAQLRSDVPGLDWRGEGGYVVAPPSVHPSGRRYAWRPNAAAFADAPDWLIELVTSKNSNGSASVAAATPEQWRSFINEDVDGSRRGHAVARLYGLLVRRYLDPVVALDLVRLFNNAHCKPPLDDAEVVRIANDIAAREASRRRSITS